MPNFRATFFHGWPKVVKASSHRTNPLASLSGTGGLSNHQSSATSPSIVSTQPIINLALSPSGLYIAAISQTRLSIWAAAKDCVLLAMYKRDSVSAGADGSNTQIIWKQNSPTVICLTSLGHLHYYSLIKSVRPGAGNIMTLQLHDHRDLSIDGISGISYIARCVDGIVLGTNMGDLIFCAWSGEPLRRLDLPPTPSETAALEHIRKKDPKPAAASKTSSNSRSGMSNSIPFGIVAYFPQLDKQALDDDIPSSSSSSVFKSTTLPPGKAKVTYIHYCAKMRAYGILLESGASCVATIGRSKILWSEKVMLPCWLSSSGVTCISLNALHFYAAVGTEDGEILIFQIDNLYFSAGSSTAAFDSPSAALVRKLSLSPWSFNAQDTGAVTSLSWSRDHRCLASSWQKYGVVLWNHVGCATASTLPEIPERLAGWNPNDSDNAKEKPQYGTSLWFGGFRQLEWTKDGCNLISIMVKGHGEIIKFSLLKSGGAASLTSDDVTRLVVHGDDRVFLPPDEVGSRWKQLQVPNGYLEDNWPIRLVAYDPDTQFIAVAGKQGVAVCIPVQRRWRLFGDVIQEKQIAVEALLWYRGCLCIVNHTVVGDYEILIYPRDHLDSASMLLKLSLTGKPAAIDISGDVLVVINTEGLVNIFSLCITSGSDPRSSALSSIYARKMNFYHLCDSMLPFLPGPPPSPSTTQSIPSTPTFSGSNTAATATTDDNNNIINNGSLNSSSSNTYNETANTASNSRAPSPPTITSGKVDFAVLPCNRIIAMRAAPRPRSPARQTSWFVVSNPGPKVWPQPEDAPALPAFDDDGNIPLLVLFADGRLFQITKGKCRLLAQGVIDFWFGSSSVCKLVGPIVWVYSSRGVHVLLNAFQDLSLASTTTSSSITLSDPLELEPDVFPAGGMLGVEAVVGISPMVWRANNWPLTAQAVRCIAPAATAGIPLSEVRYQLQGVLHVLLSHLIVHQPKFAIQVAKLAESMRNFQYALELLLLAAIEANNPDRMRLTLDLLRSFDGYVDVVVACARKVEESRWPRLFPAAGRPRELFERCIQQKRLRTGAGYLIIIQGVMTPAETWNAALSLLKAALEDFDLSLSGEILRFLSRLEVELEMLADPKDIQGSAEEVMCDVGFHFLKKCQLRKLWTLRDQLQFPLVPWLSEFRSELSCLDYADSSLFYIEAIDAVHQDFDYPLPAAPTGVLDLMTRLENTSTTTTRSDNSGSSDQDEISNNNHNNSSSSSSNSKLMLSQELKSWLGYFTKAGLHEWSLVIATVLFWPPTIRVILEEDFADKGKTTNLYHGYRKALKDSSNLAHAKLILSLDDFFKYEE